MADWRYDLAPGDRIVVGEHREAGGTPHTVIDEWEQLSGGAWYMYIQVREDATGRRSWVADVHIKALISWADASTIDE
jgi:hypothetical protein